MMTNTATNKGAAVKSYTCGVEIIDTRCPDGCCGDYQMYVKSPTGRELHVRSYDLAVVGLRAKLLAAVDGLEEVRGKKGELLGHTCRRWQGARRGTVRLTVAEMIAVRDAAPTFTK